MNQEQLLKMVSLVIQTKLWWSDKQCPEEKRAGKTKFEKN